MQLGAHAVQCIQKLRVVKDRLRLVAGAVVTFGSCCAERFGIETQLLLRVAKRSESLQQLSFDLCEPHLPLRASHADRRQLLPHLWLELIHKLLREVLTDAVRS